MLAELEIGDKNGICLKSRTSLNIVVILGYFRILGIAYLLQAVAGLPLRNLTAAASFSRTQWTMERKQQKPPSTCRSGKRGKPTEMKYRKMTESKISLKKTLFVNVCLQTSLKLNPRRTQRVVFMAVSLSWFVPL